MGMFSWMDEIRSGRGSTDIVPAPVTVDVPAVTLESTKIPAGGDKGIFGKATDVAKNAGSKVQEVWGGMDTKTKVAAVAGTALATAIAGKMAFGNKKPEPQVPQSTKWQDYEKGRRQQPQGQEAYIG